MNIELTLGMIFSFLWTTGMIFDPPDDKIGKFAMWSILICIYAFMFLGLSR